MRIFPLIIDSRLGFTRNGAAPLSLLLTPLGGGTVLSQLHSRLARLHSDALSIMPTFEPDAAYETRIREACPAVESVFGEAGLPASLGAYEASDWLLLVDPSCFPAADLDPAQLFDDPEAGPRWVKHLVALEANTAHTKEYVESDAEGRVRRIQRYYHFVTWPFTAGISCSLLPVSCALLALDLPFGSLPELRRALATRGIASRDIPLSEGAIDVSQERGLLALNERVVLESSTGRGKGGGAPAGRLVAGEGCRIDPSARIIGPVVLQEGVEVQEGATIVGPSAIGAGSSVGRGAIVAQCLIGRSSQIAPGTTVRHRVLFGSIAPERADSSRAAAPPPLPLEGRFRAPLPLSFEPRRRPLYPRFKRAAEALISLAGLIALSPFLLLVAALIKLGSKGPVLYGDEREGKDGRVFRCLKFRTMVHGAHARQRSLQSRNQVDGPQFKIEADPRATRLGAFLRDTCIDELPQLINVVKGEMSVVGPRPSPFRENQLCIPWREARLSVRPGITGLWQVCRHRRATGDFHQWIYYDLLYVRHQSLWVDLKILVATLVSLGGKWSVPLSWIVAPRKYFERRRSPRDPDLADARSTA